MVPSRAGRADNAGRETTGLVQDRGVHAVERGGYLSESGTGIGLAEDLLLEIGTLEPVGGPEGLGREAASAGEAAEALDAVGRGSPSMEAVADPGPTESPVVEVAPWRRATGRAEVTFVEQGVGSHAEARASSVPTSRADRIPGRSHSGAVRACFWLEGAERRKRQVQRTSDQES